MRKPIIAIAILLLGGIAFGQKDFVYAYHVKSGACMAIHKETGIFIKYLPNTVEAAKEVEQYLMKKVAAFKKRGKVYGVHGACGDDHSYDEFCRWEGSLAFRQSGSEWPRPLAPEMVSPRKGDFWRIDPHYYYFDGVRTIKLQEVKDTVPKTILSGTDNFSSAQINFADTNRRQIMYRDSTGWHLKVDTGEALRAVMRYFDKMYTPYKKHQ